MKKKFWKFMDSAKGFWTLIGTMIVLGFAYMFGAHHVIEKIMKARRQKESGYDQESGRG